MPRSIQIFSVLLLLALAQAIRAQTPPTCGVVEIDGPSQMDPGTPLVLKAKITGLIHTTKPEFKWSLSAGTITSGQGTETVTVDTGGLGGLDVLATVELSGAPPGCIASRTIRVNVPAIGCGLAFDQYGDIKFEDEKARLDNFAIQLTNEPLSSGQILMYAGQETFENEAAERLARAKAYLVDVRGLDPNLIVTSDCGFTQDLTIKLYVVPLGATFPACDNSTLAPFSEVKFTKPRPNPSKKR